MYKRQVLADLEIVERKLDRGRKERANPLELAAFERIRAALEEERPVRSIPPDQLNREVLRGFALLTERPLLVALNTAEENAGAPMPAELEARVRDLDAAGLVLSAALEAEIASLPADEQGPFLEELGLEQPALHRFIRAAYALLDLISFFTVGEDEVRAWTIRRGMHAREAAGRIHSDLERGFIRAEVTPCDVFMEHGSEQAVKDHGRLQVEGKDYVVADGDILSIRFKV